MLAPEWVKKAVKAVCENHSDTWPGKIFWQFYYDEQEVEWVIEVRPAKVVCPNGEEGFSDHWNFNVAEVLELFDRNNPLDHPLDIDWAPHELSINGYVECGGFLMVRLFTLPDADERPTSAVLFDGTTIELAAEEDDSSTSPLV